MIFLTHIPKEPLNKYIENIVYYEGYSAQHIADKLLPDGSINIIMNMLDKPSKLYTDVALASYQEFSGSFISGQHKGYIFIEANHSSMMVTRFKVGGASPFFDFPISKLNDRVQQLEPLFGKQIEETRLKIIAEKDFNSKFEIIEKYFLDKIKNGVEENPALSIAINELVDNPYKATTKDLAKKAKISQKHLISLFDKHIGLTPKTLARIFRFQKVILQIEKEKNIDWLQITYDCGYHDQSHFVKDFYAFSGINPSAYPNQRGEHLNYLPIK